MPKYPYNKGFTLVELLMALAIVGIVAAFTIGIASSVRNLGKTGETERRMKIIAENTVNFYRDKQEIPRPLDASGSPVSISTASLPYTVEGNVPISTSYLNLEQKYRLDGWGNYMVFVMALTGMVTINGIDIPPSGAGYHTDANTDIDGLLYKTSSDDDGRRVAGLVISSGPNQQFGYNVTGQDPTIITLNAGSDDMILPVDVSAVARAIAAEELSVLQSKARAFDSMYTGIDNDGDNSVDEDGDTEDISNCPPLDPSNNDPNNGMKTLDGILDGDYDSLSCSCEATTNPANWFSITNDAIPGNTPPTNDKVNARIYCLYNLSVTTMVDPWLTAYTWGSKDDLLKENEDPRYHKFYSWGPDKDTDYTDPDAAVVEDDIIP